MEEINRSGAANINSQADPNLNLLEDIKIFGKSKDKNSIKNINKVINNLDSSVKSNTKIHINNNGSNYVNTEIIEKIQNEMKNFENLGLPNSSSTKDNTQNTNLTFISTKNNQTLNSIYNSNCNKKKQ